MQTFLPYPDFAASAAVLDPARLGKQRIEALTILRYVCGRYKHGGWRNHPAILMWKGYEDALRIYLWEMIREWTCRGYRNTIRVRLPRTYASGSTVMPWWLGDERLHSSHRAALLYKNYDWYSRFGWTEKPALNYFWPVRSRTVPHPPDQ